MSIKKQYLKTNPVCKVTFRLEPEEAQNAKSVHIVGEFNNWNKQKTPMKRLKNGAFTLTLDLEPKRQYQFRYLIDQHIWANDAAADHYAPTEFAGTDNSVVIL